MTPSSVVEAQEYLPRRRPSQERSRRRFDEILRAARALLVEVGFESFTSEQVALRAGVPIGSLYQFFGNKYAVICELDRLDTADVQAELDTFAAEIPTLDWAAADGQAARPPRRPVAHRPVAARGLAGDAGDPAHPGHRRGARARPGRAGHQGARAAHAGSKIGDRQTIAEVLVHVTYSMLNFSIRDGQSHPDAVVQLKTLLTGYLAAAEAEAARNKLAGA